MRNALAVVIIASCMGTWLLAQAPRTADVEFKAAQHKEEVEGDLRERSIRTGRWRGDR